MEKLYTENALIRYIYNESDFFERLEVEHALEYDKEVNELYIELCSLFDELPKVLFVPSQKSIARILSESRLNPLEA